ncbi:MAG: MinD/ParA family protein [Myxococcota bacterium]
MARKNLGDVLHYFIPEDEQSAALERGAPPDLARHPPSEAERSSRGPAPRVCVPAGPDRLLWCALALELAGALAAERGGARVEMSFAASPLLPSVPGVRLRALERAPAALAGALAEVPGDEAVLVLERPEQLAQFLAQPERALLDCVLLPVDASASGVARALRVLREIAPALAGMPVFAWVVGARSSREASELGERLCAAARRQHSVEVEVAPALPSDPALFRALLRGESVHAADDGTSAGARELRALSRRLGERRAA